MGALERLTTHINIEMTGDTKQYLVSAKQGDKATRYVIARLLNNGTIYIIPTGARVAFNVEKPDGKHVYNTCTYAGAEVTVELTNQILAVPGTAYCDIEVRTNDNTQLITSASFTIEIERAIRNDDAIESSNEFTELEDRIAEHIKNIIDTDSAIKETENKRVAEENKRVAEENKRIAEENKRVAAENERVAAENERIAAENERIAAENERIAAEKKREQNEQMRIEQEKQRQKNIEREIVSMQDMTAIARAEVEKSAIIAKDAKEITKQAGEIIAEVNNKLAAGEFNGPKGDNGQRGSRWSAGTAITGTNTTATVFSGSGITDALVNDMYLNTSTGNTYRCTTAGAASVAKWAYVGCIKGLTGAQGPAGVSKISDSSAITTPGEYALDAREKNAALQGTMAYELAQLNSKFTNLFANGLVSDPDAVTTPFATVNGWDSGTKNVPSDFTACMGILITVFSFHASFGSPAQSEKACAQALIYNGKVKIRASFGGTKFGDWV